MIKAILLDLDDTLIETHTTSFFSDYINQLGAYCSPYARPRVAIGTVMRSYQDIIDRLEPHRTLHDRLMKLLAFRLNAPVQELEPFLDAFYDSIYRDLCKSIGPVDGAHSLLTKLFGRAYRVVIATNPGLPIKAALHRLRAGGIDPAAYPFEFVTGLENTHFSKPNPDYYAELLLRLGCEPHEAIMVGDDWENDMVGSGCVGMHRYYVHPSWGEATLDSDEVPCGDLADFEQLIESGWYDQQNSGLRDHRAGLSFLAATPAAISDLCRDVNPALLVSCPAKDEWSVRDVICHLNDYEQKQNRENLERIARSENPFLLADYDPWAAAASYKEVDPRTALEVFSVSRMDTVKWIYPLSDSVWDRPGRSSIFGPTTFAELVNFIIQHDRTHIDQMRSSLNYVRDNQSL